MQQTWPATGFKVQIEAEPGKWQDASSDFTFFPITDTSALPGFVDHRADTYASAPNATKKLYREIARSRSCRVSRHRLYAEVKRQQIEPSSPGIRNVAMALVKIPLYAPGRSEPIAQIAVPSALRTGHKCKSARFIIWWSRVIAYRVDWDLSISEHRPPRARLMADDALAFALLYIYPQGEDMHRSLIRSMERQLGEAVATGYTRVHTLGSGRQPRRMWK